MAGFFESRPIFPKEAEPEVFGRQALENAASEQSI
jgi:hypothetical protein